MFFQNISRRNNFLNFQLLLIPISYIAGNLLLNLNIVILVLSVCFFFGTEIFKIRLNRTDKLVLLFFTYILLNGIYNNFYNFDFPESKSQNTILIKSIFYFRFFILYFALKFLIKLDIVNFKLLFLFYSACSLFVCFDLLYQYRFGVDIFGLEGGGRRLSGPFGDELIAGSYIQRFFIFSIFSLMLFIKPKKKWIFNFSLLLILIISVFGILISGNRIPLILFIMMLIILFFYLRQIRILLLSATIFIALLFSYLIKTDQNFNYHYGSFSDRSFEIITYLDEKISGKPIPVKNTYIKEFELGYATWQLNKLFGGGIKSFYWNCRSIDSPEMLRFGAGTKPNCNSHPHNYYLQILGELGIFGFILTISLFLSIIFKCLKKIHLNKKIDFQNKIIIPFFIIYIVEIFPFKTSGSFFTSVNSSFLFFIIAFIVGLSEYKSLKKN